MLTIKQVYGKEKAVDKLVKIRYISNYSELFSKYQKCPSSSIFIIVEALTERTLS